MAGQDWDAIVVGAGVGGAAAAYYLGQMGLKVLVVEKARLPLPRFGCLGNERRRSDDQEWSVILHRSSRRHIESQTKEVSMIRVRDFREVEAEPAGDGVTMRLVIGPGEGAPFFNMRVFEVQPGHASPYHNHWWEHEVFVLSGEGVVKTEQGNTPIHHGSTVFVPGGEMHQFQNAGEGVLRFLCLVPQDWLQGTKKPAA